MEISYRAYDSSGRIQDGTLNARDQREALAKLSELGLLPITVGEGRKTAIRSWLSQDLTSGKPNLKQRSAFLHMLSSLLEAGVPLDGALRAVEAAGASKALSKLATHALKNITEGKSLSGALDDPSTGFQPVEIGLIRSGEQNALLVKSLTNLSQNLSKRLELRSKLFSAMTYPLVLVAMSILSLTVIVSVLVPNMAPLFEQSGQEPPLLIRTILNLRSFMLDNGFAVLAALIALTVILFASLRHPAIKKRLHKIWFKLPLIRRFEAARICRTLSLLLGNGMPVQNALRFAGDVCKSLVTRDEMQTACDKVIAGSRFHDAMRGVSVFRGSDLQLIGIGESTNKLDIMLGHVATSLEAEADRSVERLMTLMTPLATVGLGGLIAGLIVSVMSAILSVNELVTR
jgi:general secretion pathway protein F